MYEKIEYNELAIERESVSLLDSAYELVDSNPESIKIKH